ncbi:MAG: tryptophan-rich sensory protein [Acidobacteriota bacterium]
MKALHAVLLSLAICAAAALLEGLCAGKNVRPFFASLKFPRYSAPLWIWSIIGGLYYVIFGFVLYRLFRITTASSIKLVVFALIVFMLLVNALTNYLIFRAQDLRLSFIVGALFPVLDIALFLCLLQLDTVAAQVLIPYLLYRAYGVWWGYALWKLNRSEA